MRSGPRSLCPVNVAVEILGDRWTLLVLRDLMLKGRVTFKSMVEAEEGIATNILADRLSRLEAEGIVEKVRDESDGRRVRYGLSEKGLDLAPGTRGHDGLERHLLQDRRATGGDRRDALQPQALSRRHPRERSANGEAPRPEQGLEPCRPASCFGRLRASFRRQTLVFLKARS